MEKTPARKLDSRTWDVVVIGGGPAGMMAAGHAAEAGASVLLLEKNKSLGKKLAITGGGRCNITNAEFDNKKFLAKFKDAGKFLASPFSVWSVKESLDFFHANNLPTKTEAELRVFPESNSAQSVVDTCTDFVQKSGVTVVTNVTVVHIHADGNTISSIELRDKTHIRAKAYVLATGGISHPETGSTGDGYTWLKTLGHRVHDARASLVPVVVKGALTRRAAGSSVQNAKVTLYQNGAKQSQLVGKILFTHVGLSGPAILNSSGEIGELLKYGPVEIEIDLLPDMGYEKVHAAILLALKDHHTRKIKNSLKDLHLTPALVPLILESAKIDPETFCHSITREARLRLIQTLKHSRYQVERLLGADKAVITAGGVELTEVDFKNMRSLKYENLYLVGDILNIDRPSGGYSLQLCWTTGYVAGSAAAKVSKE